MNKTIKQKWLFLLFCCPLFTYGQSISQSVIGNAGSYQVNTNGDNFHWTVGELSVENFENGSVLSQGFHQLYTYLVEVVEIKNESFDVNLFPNPTSGWLRLATDKDLKLQIKLSNMLGQTILSGDTNTRETDFDISSLPAGMYLFTVFYDNTVAKTFKITKN